MNDMRKLMEAVKPLFESSTSQLATHIENLVDHTEEHGYVDLRPLMKKYGYEAVEDAVMDEVFESDIGYYCSTDHDEQGRLVGIDVGDPMEI